MNIDDIINNFSKNLNESVDMSKDENSNNSSSEETKILHPSSELLMDILKEVFHVDEEIFTDLALEEQDKTIIPNDNESTTFSEDSKIVTGPDGTKWLVEKSGLWINLDEAEDLNILKNHNEYSLDIRTNYVDPSDELNLSAHVIESQEHDSPTLILNIFIPHNSTFVLTNEKNVVDSYVYFGITSQKIDNIGKIEIETHYIPSCKFYSSDHSTHISLDTSPSAYYKFNRPSKLYATCSNELVTNGSSGTSMCPKSNNQTLCSFYESETWDTVYSLVNSKDSLAVQQRRYGNGTYRYRLYDTNNKTVVFSDSDEFITSKNEGNIYCSFDLFQKFVSEWIDEKGFIFEILDINKEKIDIEKVYTQYVANA